MKLNMKHVFIWYTIAISCLIIGLIFKQDLILYIGFIGSFAPTLPIMLAVAGSLFDYEQNKKEIGKQ